MATKPNQLDLIVDVEGKRLLQSFTGNKEAAPPRLTFGDKIPVTVRVVRQATSASDGQPWSEIPLPNHTIRLGIGTPAGDPSSGTFTLTFDSNTTAALNYNASASQVQSALNALSTVQSAGNTTVTAFTSGGYRVVFGNLGARNLLTADTSGLYPTTGAYINEAQAGDAGTKEVQIVSLKTEPAAFSTLSTNLDAAGATIATVRAGVANNTSEIQTLTLDPEPYAGTYTLTTGPAAKKTAAIAWNVTASDLQAAIIAADTTNLTSKVTVTGAFPAYTVEYDNTLGDVAALTADVSGLTAPTGRKGDLDLNVAGLVEHLDGATEKPATLEVEIRNTSANTSWTVAQSPCTVAEDLISNAPASKTPLPDYFTNTAFLGARGNLDTTNLAAGLANILLDINQQVSGFTVNTANYVWDFDHAGRYLVTAFVAIRPPAANTVNLIINKSGTETVASGEYLQAVEYENIAVSGIINCLCYKFFSVYPSAQFVTVIHDELIMQVPDHQLTTAKIALDQCVDSLNDELGWTTKIRCGWAPGKTLYEAK